MSFHIICLIKPPTVITKEIKTNPIEYADQKSQISGTRARSKVKAKLKYMKLVEHALRVFHLLRNTI